MGIPHTLFNFRPMQLFYSTLIEANHITLEGEEARHVQVLRKRPGDPIQVVDGKGTLYRTEIDELEKKRCILTIKERVSDFGKLPFRLGIAIAPTKNIARLEWFLEKTTEIGITDIYPILCDRSERKQIRMDRLAKILVSAMKQSVKGFLPRLHPLQKISSFLPEMAHWSQTLIAHCEEGEKVGISDIYRASSDVLILIGPEGDFSHTEIDRVLEQGGKAIHLGPHRLRTETAGIVACHTVQLLHQMANKA